MVLAFHGSGVNATQMVGFCGLNELAEREGFVVAYPEGSGRVPQARTWNAGLCCGHAHRHQVDDVGFLSTLIASLTTRPSRPVLTIDKQRVYATGMSNGAMMSYRLASERSDLIAAIAPVAGPMAMLDCAPAKPVPVCHFHGDADEFTPWHGGKGPRSVSRAEFLSVPYTIEQWVRANRCSVEPTLRTLPVIRQDGTRVTEICYASQDGRGEILLYQIHGGGHVWPGRDSGMEVLGRVTNNLNANEVMWRFFQRFRREPL